MWQKAELIRLKWDSQVVSWSIRCTGGGQEQGDNRGSEGAVAAAELEKHFAPVWASEELQASFESMQLALAPEKALQVAAAVATVAAVVTAHTTVQAKGAVERGERGLSGKDTTLGSGRVKGA